MPGFQKICRHAGTHVPQSDYSNLHGHRLMGLTLPQRLALGRQAAVHTESDLAPAWLTRVHQFQEDGPNLAPVTANEPSKHHRKIIIESTALY